jgi:hypothetical protein
VRQEATQNRLGDWQAENEEEFSLFMPTHKQIGAFCDDENLYLAISKFCVKAAKC